LDKNSGAVSSVQSEDAGKLDPARLLLIAECASQLEVDWAADADDMAVIEGFDRLKELLRPWRATRGK
jgi:hypothetical protein